MAAAVETVLSVFGLIGVGYFVARLRLVPEGSGDGVAAFVFNVAMPALVFRALATSDFGGFSPWWLWAVYFAGVALAWAAGTLVVRRLFGRDRRAGLVAGVSASFSNTVLVGIPLVTARFGEPGLLVALAVISIHLPVMLGASMALAGLIEREEAGGGHGLREGLSLFFRRLAANPIVVGILLGGVWALADLPLAGVPARIVGDMAAIAGPTALIASGMGFARYGVSGTVLPAFVLTLIKLALMPAFVFAAGLALGLPPLVTAVAVALAACPTGVNAFLIAVQLGTGQALATNAMMLSTLLGVVSVTLWLALVARLFGV